MVFHLREARLSEDAINLREELFELDNERQALCLGTSLEDQV